MFENTGIIDTINPAKCTARVKFDDTGQISDELQIIVRGSFKTKEYWMPRVGEQVYVSFTQQKKGYIMGSVFSEEDPPPVTDENKRHLEFEDGTTIEYDSKTHTLSIQSEGPINIKTSGNINVTGDVIADGISLKEHTHPGTGSPNGGG